MTQLSLFDQPAAAAKTAAKPLPALHTSFLQHQKQKKDQAQRDSFANLQAEFMPPVLRAAGWLLYNDEPWHPDGKYLAWNSQHLITTENRRTISEVLAIALHASCFWEILPNDALHHYWAEARHYFTSLPAAYRLINGIQRHAIVDFHQRS